MSEFSDNLPPISSCNYHTNSKILRFAIPALLHQAHASCGRAFCVGAALLALTLPVARRNQTIY